MDNYKDITINRSLLANLQQPAYHITLGTSNEKIWAHIDENMVVTHLDMELCAQGPPNMYSALALAIWNKAVETEREACARVCENMDWCYDDKRDFAEAIRARGKQE